MPEGFRYFLGSDGDCWRVSADEKSVEFRPAGSDVFRHSLCRIRDLTSDLGLTQSFVEPAPRVEKEAVR
jgi:hypothetical protein